MQRMVTTDGRFRINELSSKWDFYAIKIICVDSPLSYPEIYALDLPHRIEPDGR